MIAMEDRTRVREKHGIANARKVSLVSVEGSDIQAVIVTDGFGEVLLSLATSSYPAALTVEQADLLAKQITESARRVEQTP